jgi:hypothetical protein
MTLRQQAKLSMLMVLCEYLSQKTEIVNLIPNLSDLLIQLQSLISQIQTQSQQQSLNQTGVAITKKEARKQLVDSAADIARKLSAYALMVNNDSLLKEIHIQDYELLRMPDEKLKEACQLIYERGLANVEAAAQYGLHSRPLTYLLNTIDAFNTIIPKPRLTETDKKMATLRLVELFAEADVILEKTDMLVDIVKISQPLFHGSYKSARMIIDRVGRGYVLKVTVLDAADNQPLKGVTCKIILEAGTTNNKEKAIVKKTALKGGFYIKSIPEGIYNMIVYKTGYLQINQVINISKNEFLNLNLSLEKL